MRTILKFIVLVFLVQFLTSCENDDPSPKHIKKSHDMIFERSGDIYAMQSDGTDTVSLTNSSTHFSLYRNSSALFAPDGSAVLIKGGDGKFYILGLDGSGLIALSDISPVSTPQWSPNGTRILFQKVAQNSAQPNTRDIFMVNVDGGNLINLTNSPAFYGDPIWVNDDEAIYSKFGTVGTEMFRMNINSVRSRKVEIGLTEFGAYQLSPDRTEMIVVGEYNRTTETRVLYKMNIDGSNRVTIAEDKIHRLGNWSPDGTKILFTTLGWEGDIYDSNVYVINKDGTGLTNLSQKSQSPDKGWNPSWSPDGSVVALSIRDITNLLGYDIYTVNIDGSNLVNITNTMESGEFAVHWCPGPEN